MRDFVRPLVCASLILLTAGCAMTTRIFGTSPQAGVRESEAIVEEVCKTFPAITYSRLDTTETIRQVQDHNRVRDALCK